MIKSMSDYRREYGSLTLTRGELSDCPIEQFNNWFEQIVETDNYDPTAMVLSTVDENHEPDSRVVLLKGIHKGHFIFYTNYDSPKAKHIESNDCVSLNFFWPFMARQVRIRGKASRLDENMSDNYFQTRPKLSQIAAHSSNQSEVIDSRDVLEAKMNALISQYANLVIQRPTNWGGFAVLPYEIEFWQGRDNRLHDRMLYQSDDNGHSWDITRLAP